MFFFSKETPRRLYRKLKIVVDDAASDTSDDEATRDIKHQVVLANKERRRSLHERRNSLADLVNKALTENPVTRRRGSLHIEKTVTKPNSGLKLTLRERAIYALDLETSMRGVGWNFTSADVRHTKYIWT